jgi:hypothetical protein
MDNSKCICAVIRCIAILSLASTITAFVGNGQAATAPSIFNVAATNVTATTATITWSTTKRADSQVAYFIGSAKPKWTACCSPSNTTSHSVTLSGLTPNTGYNFFVESTPTGSSTPIDSTTSTFHTSAAFSISNVAATNITETTAIITWTTNQKADSQVAYFIGSAKPKWTACCSPSNTTAHSVTLTGLMPNAVYNFFAESMPTGGSKPIDSTFSTFQTPSAKGLEDLGAGSNPYAVVDSNGVIDITWTATNRVMFAQSKDNGVTFSIPKLVVASPAGAQSIQLDAKNNIFILVGYNPTSMLNGNTAVLARSSDGGKTFSTVIVKQNIFASLLLVQPSGIVDFAYTTSENGTDPDDAVRETHSTDGGQTFVNDQLVWGAPHSADDVLQFRGAVGPQGQVYVAWAVQDDLDCFVEAAASQDGVNFKNPPTFLWVPDFCNDNPEIVVDAAGNVSITWDAGTIYFSRSQDQGQTFSPPTIVSKFGGDDTQKFVAGPNGEIDLVFAGVNFTRSLDQGVTWSTPLNLALPNLPPGFVGAQNPQIVVDANGKITIAWEDDTNGGSPGDSDIYVSTSTDGKTFRSAVNISNASGAFTSAPTVLITPQGFRYIYWYETSKNNTANTNVLFYAVQ